MIRELRLPRFEYCLGDLHRMLPAGARCIRVRWTSLEMVCIYQ